MLKPIDTVVPYDMCRPKWTITKPLWKRHPNQEYIVTHEQINMFVQTCVQFVHTQIIIELETSWVRVFCPIFFQQSLTYFPRVYLQTIGSG